MHFVTGGAYNGKSDWVRKFYKAEGTALDCWYCAYHSKGLSIKENMLEGNVCVVEGIEEYIREECSSLDIQTCGDTWKKRLLDWKAWEMDWPKRQLIIIGSDITKGIVPLAKEERIWRDVTGWVYQDISAIADRVDVIWYGLNIQLK